MKNKKMEQSLKAQVARMKKAATDRLGKGIWGLSKEKKKFTHEEIVFLFARIFPALGIDHIKKVQTQFPDCIAVKDGKEIGIEFEKTLDSFRDHINKHNLKKCQYIVCWDDDLELHDPMRDEIEKYDIEVIELKELYEEMRIKDRRSAAHISQADVDKFTENQLKALKAFIEADTYLLEKDPIAETIGISGKGLGGALKGFPELEKRTGDWILRKRPDRKTWEFNKKHREKVIKTLKKYKI